MKAWLFGSYSRGEQREDSDVDILIQVYTRFPIYFSSMSNSKEIVSLNSSMACGREGHVKREMIATKFMASTYLNCLAPTIRWINSKFEDIIIENIDNFVNRSYDFKSGLYYRETVKMNYLTDFILYYGIGILCVFYKKYSLLNKLLKIEIVSVPCDFLKTEYAVCLLKEYMIDKELVGKGKNSLLGAKVRVSFQSLFAFMGKEETIQDCLFIFERVKSLYANRLFYNENVEEGYIPYEECEYRNYSFRRTGKDLYEEFFSKIEKEKDNSQVISQGMFKGRYETYQEILTKVSAYQKKHVVWAL